MLVKSRLQLRSRWIVVSLCATTLLEAHVVNSPHLISWVASTPPLTPRGGAYAASRRPPAAHLALPTLLPPPAATAGGIAW
jgi:hypothetical protein